MSEYQGALNALKRAGYVTAEVHFSGGNDDGGVDSLRATKTEGGEWVDLPHHYLGGYWDDHRREYVNHTGTPEQEADNALAKLLSKPVYDRYYSFAGDFYVNGVVRFDTINNTVTMDGSESIPTDYGIHYDF